MISHDSTTNDEISTNMLTNSLVDTHLDLNAFTSFAGNHSMININGNGFSKRTSRDIDPLITNITIPRMASENLTSAAIASQMDFMKKQLLGEIKKKENLWKKNS